MTTAICIASGPSLTADDVNYCKGKGKIYVANNCFKLAPWADVLYACDGRWWQHYHDQVDKVFKGERWTIDDAAAVEYGLKTIGVLNDAIWSEHPSAITLGGNSGHQMMNLACIQGASKIVLLGYDMKPRADGIRHWHGDHINALLQTNPVEYVNWRKNFKEAKPFIKIPVVNCTRDTALEAFDRAPLRETI
jgi:hypothetical protein